MNNASTSRKKTGTNPPTYAFYRSGPGSKNPKAVSKNSRKRHLGLKLLGLLLVVLLIWGGYTAVKTKVVQSPASTSSNQSASTAKQDATSTNSQTAVAPVNHCSSNSLTQLVIVSISQRHLWACNTTVQAYDSAVVTGMEFLPADLTPTGTYHIYAKETDVYLKGSDSTGSWDDFVYYWMPFLDNQYGVYGFHDATWRAANAFGNISPNSADASHGCVESPLATAKWLYDWSQIGTTVTIES